MNTNTLVRIIQGLLNIIGAVPGSGKTTTLIESIVYALFEWHILGSRILVITFSRNMATELEQKLADKGIRNVQCRTFHSFGLQLIKNDYQLFGYSVEPKLIKGAKEARYIRNFARTYFKKDWPLTLNQLVKVFRLNSSNGIPAGTILARYQLDKEQSLAVRKFMSALYRSLRNDNFITYQQMIRKVVRKMQSDSRWASQVASNYDCLFIDEYQDMNPTDQKLARLLIDMIDTSLIVGDDMQNIYAFRGTVPNAIKRLKSMYPDANKLRRHTSHRITDPMAKLVNAVLAENDIDLTIKANKQGEKPVLYTARDRTTMYTQVTSTINRLIDDGVDPEEIAVLAPFNFSLSWLTRHLTPKGIPFQMRKQYPDQNTILKNFKLFLKAVAGTDQQGACAKLLKRKAKLTNSQATALSEDLTKNIQKKELGLTDKQPDKIRPIRKAVLWAREDPTLHRILSAFNKSMVGRKGRYHQRAVENVLKVKGIRVDNNTTPKELHLMMKEREKAIPSGVVLSTIHSSKGGQWEHVLIIDLYDEVMSKNREIPEAVDYEDKLRQFYVATTRASVGLHLFQLKKEITVPPSTNIQNTRSPKSPDDRNKLKKYRYTRYRFLPEIKLMRSLCKVVNGKK